MHTVYVLRDESGKFYKGHTRNLERRFKEHVSGYTKITSRMKGLKIVYTENYDNLEEAVRREKYLKSSAGRKFLKLKLIRS